MIHTVFQSGLVYRGMADVELRGLLDGTAKLERNVATQYHVRAGCEGSKPTRGQYEVMRVLQRWDIRALPSFASVHAARLILVQEDTSGFPHRHPPRWPVDFYLHDTRKAWGPGRGGTRGDNQSPPEPGDAWWLEAKAGELRWSEAGSGFASDEDPNADRGGHPLAAARLCGPRETLVLTGPRFADHIEGVLRRGGALDLLLKAADMDEAWPGSVKTFYSSEYGDDLTPVRRPRLEIEWSAPAAWSEVRPFVLEPGSSVTYSLADAVREGKTQTLAASITLESDGRCEARAAVLSVDPEVHALGWTPDGGEAGAQGAPVPLEVPVRGAPGPSFQIQLTTAIRPVTAGERVTIRILETWCPDVRSPEELTIHFRFTAPSGRIIELPSRSAGGFEHVGELCPDEMGVWSYAWRTRPDARFPEQVGSGRFSVVRAPGELHVEALRGFTDAALRDGGLPRSLVERRRTHFRLTALLREARATLGAAERGGASTPEGAAAIRALIERIGEALPRFD